MSVTVEIYKNDEPDDDYYGRHIVDQNNVVGHALVLVVKKENGDLDVERIIGINADSAEDNAVAGDFIKTVEKKLAEIFEPVEEPKQAKIWVPE
jgi:hypothetical protein